MPSDALSSTTSLTGSRSCAAVASSCTLSSSEPSPVTHTTVASGRATWAPIAAGRPKPIVPSPPEVIQRRGRSKRRRLAAHIWCWPTSVVTIASPLTASSASSAASAALRGGAVGAPAVDPLPPGVEPRRVALVGRRDRGQRALRAADDRHVGGDVLADLGRVDVDVHDLGARGELVERRRSRGRRSARRRRRSGRPRPSPSWRRGVPCMPSIPSHCGSLAGNAPSAISVVVTGAPVSRASAASSAAASACTTPPPAYSTGRRAAASASRGEPDLLAVRACVRGR